LSAQAEQMNIIVQELVNLVGGNATSKKQATHTPVNHQTAHTMVSVHKLTKTDHALHDLAQTAGKKMERKLTANTKAAAAKAIPLDEKTNKDEFNDFNS
jgi:hypothetical protein